MLLARDISKKKKFLKDKVKSCKEKTLESEICRTINGYVSSCLSDDRCRRVIAIIIMLLAVVGLVHILVMIF